MVSDVNLNSALQNSSASQARGTSEGVRASTLKNAAMAAKAQAYGENMAASGGAQAAIEKALEEASLPKSERNIDVVRQMLQNQMSIDRDSLRRVVTQTNVFREADVSTLILMNKNGMPVNHFTAAQFQAYLNNEQQLTGQIGEALDVLLETLEQGNEGNTAELNMTVLDILTEGAQTVPAGEQTGVAEQSAVIAGEMTELNTAGTEAQAVAENTAVESEMTMLNTAETAANAETVNGMLNSEGQDGQLQGSNLSGLAQGVAATGLSGSAVTAEAAVVNSINAGAAERVFATTDDINTEVDGTGTDVFNGFGSDTSNLGGSGINSGETGSDVLGSGLGSQNSQMYNPNDTFMLSNVFTAEEMARFETMLGKTFENAENIGDSSITETLQQLRETILQASPEQLDEIFKSPEYQKLIGRALANKLSMKPENLKDADALNDFYKSTYTALSKLRDAAASSEKLSQALDKPMDNLKFMDTLNNLFPYVQLPLSLKEGHTHGELYVFKNGRSGSKPGDSQSVLLHLDMEHLGPTDIHMELKNRSLKLHFYMEDEASMKPIRDNYLGLLEALEKKNYSVTAEFDIRLQETTALAEALATRNGTAPEFKYNFDIRA